VLADPQIKLAGTGAEAWMRVRIYEGSTLLSETRANGSGQWAATLPVFSEGAHTLSAKVVDDAGNASAASSAARARCRRSPW
jgi:diaminopimelate epimerase